MIDIPIGKAIAAVEGDATCNGCIFQKEKTKCKLSMDVQMCSEIYRKDGKNVLFKLVDYNGGGKG